MSLGSIFVGLAIVVITIAYIVRPFRAASGAAAASRTDKLIEAWVRSAPVVVPDGENAEVPATPTATARPEPAARPSSVPATAHGAPSAGAVNFCPQCGRRVTADYRFCPGCGASLPHDEECAA